MKFFQAVLLSILVLAGGLSCSRTVEKNVMKVDLQDYTPEQIRALQRYHRLQKGILSKYYQQKAEEIEVLTGQTVEQRKSYENLRRVQLVLDQQRNEEEALLRDYYDN